MSKEFTNTSTGGQPADPYTAVNTEDIPLQQKVDDLSYFISSCKFGMMTTHDNKADRLVSRCMAVAAKESGGIDLLFHTNTESNKTNEITSDPHVNLSFLNASGEWASVSGTPTVVTDRALVKQHYTPTLKAWLGDLGDGVHDGGEEDPRIGIIRVKTETATYSLASKNILSRAANVVQGAVTGQPASINSIREVTRAEADQWRREHS